MLPIFFTLHMKTLLICIITTIFCILPQNIEARRLTPRDAFADSVMHRVFHYAQTVDTTGRDTSISYAYTKFQIRTNKRNATLMLVPTMYAVARGGGRRFINEYYNRITLDKHGNPISRRLLNVSTIPHRSNTFSALLGYMTPNVYSETLFQENILSPFHRTNRKYYKYSVTQLPFGKAQIYAYPRIKNTQLMEARAIVDTETGKISMADFEGEYDMTRFYISMVMGKEGYQTLAPKRCDMRANFRFMGNKISGMYTTIYGLPKTISDTLDNVADTALMAKVRPLELNPEEKSIYKLFYEKRKQDSDSAATQKPRYNFVKDVLWDVIGDNIVNSISHGFGKQQQGYFHISPILNPLYMGYSPRKGIVYKFDLRGSYRFNDDMHVDIGFGGGYSTKQRRFYFNIPLSWNYNNRHNGYLRIEIGNGNHISTDRIARHILGISDPKDSLFLIPQLGQMPGIGLPVLTQNTKIDKDNIYDFKDAYLRITNHWSFNTHLGMELGIASHMRRAVDPQFYHLFNYPSTYTSVAPAFALEWFPTGTGNPVLTFNYERAWKNFFGSNIEYERMEFDAQHIFYASRRRSYSMRFGMGFYTKKGDHWDFIDYTNFHDNNLPGGWNDDWSGEFELLSSQWYNTSDYYLRGNFTHEAPMMIAAWLPLIGRYIEKERIYISCLGVEHLHPYTEWGYGVTTRLITLGFFAAFQNTKFNGVGCRFGFELFRHW